MDPVTSAVIAAVAAGAATGTGKVVEAAIMDAYQNLKGLLHKKFGARSEVLKAVKAFEAKPDSAGRKEVLQEEMAAVKADQDPELVQAALGLIKIFQAREGTSQIHQTAIGNGNIQIAGDSNRIRLNTPKSNS